MVHAAVQKMRSSEIKTYKAGPRGSTNMKTGLDIGSDMLVWYSRDLAVNKSQSQYTWNNMELVALESSMNNPLRMSHHHFSVPHGTDDQVCWPTNPDNQICRNGWLTDLRS